MNIVIVSRTGWNSDYSEEIKKRTGLDVIVISDEADFTRENLEVFSPQYVFIPHWSKIIPSSIYENFRCVIFHMTDVPFGRGGSPLQNLIARGIYETKLSAIECVRELDAGSVYLKRPLSLWGSAEEIGMRSSQLVKEMIIEIVVEKPQPVPQNGEPVVFKRRKPSDGDMSFLSSLSQVFDYIRMLDAQGYPPAFFDVGAFRLEFSRASLRKDSVLADVRITLRKGDADE